MPLVTVTDLRIGYRGPALLDGVSCQIEPGQRIGLLGRNGAGKTTFMRILSGEVQPDGGDVVLAPGTKVALLPQDVPQDLAGNVGEVVAHGLPPTGDDHDLAWQSEQRLKRVLASMQLPPDVRSGGCCWPARWSAIPTCCCWTSRPITSIWRPSSGSRIFSRGGARR
jgi:ATP-binding cassette subfamily F protein uup